MSIPPASCRPVVMLHRAPVRIDRALPRHPARAPRRGACRGVARAPSDPRWFPVSGRASRTPASGDSTESWRAAGLRSRPRRAEDGTALSGRHRPGGIHHGGAVRGDRWATRERKERSPGDPAGPRRSVERTDRRGDRSTAAALCRHRGRADWSKHPAGRMGQWRYNATVAVSDIPRLPIWHEATRFAVEMPYDHRNLEQPR